MTVVIPNIDTLSPLFKVLAKQAEVVTFSKDLAKWNNQDGSADQDTYYLNVVVTSNSDDGPGRLFTGTIVGSTKNFLGRANQQLFVAKGIMVTSKDAPISRQAKFAWISGPDGGFAKLNWSTSGFDDTAAEGKAGIGIEHIKLIDGMLIGVGLEGPSKHEVKYMISFQKRHVVIPEIH